VEKEVVADEIEKVFHSGQVKMRGVIGFIYKMHRVYSKTCA
jgi:hypothetical protein